MPDKKKIQDQIDALKKLCKNLQGNDDEVVSTSQLKSAASGQHGIKDNGKVTRKQLRLGLQKRIDMLKSELAKA